MSTSSRGVTKSSWRSSRAARRPVAPRRRRDEVDDEEADKECSVCFEEPEEKSFFPCNHFNCSRCFERVDCCPICRTGKDGESGEARAARQQAQRDRERAAMGAMGGAMGGVGSVQVIAFVGGDAGPMHSGNLNFMAPAGLPPALRELLPDLLQRGLVSDAMRQMGQGGRGGRGVLRVRSILSPFGDADHAIG